MVYSHSFSSDFYGDPYNCSKAKRPETVCDALASMPKRKWDRMAREVFNVPGDRLDVDTVLLKIIETDTVGHISVPVDVWIDDEGWHTVDVY